MYFEQTQLEHALTEYSSIAAFSGEKFDECKESAVFKCFKVVLIDSALV